jgi:hypothetical protein
MRHTVMTHTVTLIDVGDHCVDCGRAECWNGSAVIDALKRFGFSDDDAYEIVTGLLPFPIDAENDADAEYIKETLENAGATATLVELKPRSSIER